MRGRAGRRLPLRARLGLFIVATVAVAALAAPLLSRHAPEEIHLRDRFAPPSFAYPAGADNLGRDVLARTLFGARVSLLVGLVVMGVALVVGAAIGTTAGVLGGAADVLAMRLIDVLMAFPGILLAIAMVAVMGPSLGHALLALCVIGWVGYARLARGQALRIREMDYVEGARAAGASELRVIVRHVIPNLLGPLIVQASLGVGGAILSEAGLSFLGLSVQPPTPSWGTMLNEGRLYLDTLHLTLPPGLLLMLTVVGFNFLGDGLRDYLDPRGSAQGSWQ